MLALLNSFSLVPIIRDAGELVSSRFFWPKYRRRRRWSKYKIVVMNAVPKITVRLFNCKEIRETIDAQQNYLIVTFCDR